MRNELEIFKMLFDLDNKQDAQEFTVWYNNHPYCKCIEELKEIVDGRCRETDARSETQSDFRKRSDCAKGSS